MSAARTFLALSVPLEGAYAGFMDGFLDWYHGKLGIRVSEREQRPHDRFLYTITLPDGRTVDPVERGLFLGESGQGSECGSTRSFRPCCLLTLPTSTGPDGYGKASLP